MHNDFNLNTTVIYHKNCTDGFMSAFLYWYTAKLIGKNQVQFIAQNYGDIPKEIKYENVLILDFCFTPEQFKNDVFLDKNIVVLDHHETSANYFKGYGNYFCVCHPNSKVKGMFDFAEQLSGAGQTWKNLNYELAGALELEKGFEHGQDTYLRLTNFKDAVQDRDLWKFELEGTEAIYEYLNSLDQTFEEWEKAIINISEEELNQKLALCQERVDMRNEIAISYAHKATIYQYNKQSTYALVNCPSNFASLVGSILSKKHAFAAMYVIDTTAKHCLVSLRSDKDTGTHVNSIAECFGGGGHVNAAGFKIDLKDNTIDQYSQLSKLFDGQLLSDF